MDLDKDGHGDLLSGGWDGKLWVFRGTADGNFAKPEKLKDAKGAVINPGKASTVHAADWDGDGDLDLLAGNIDGEVHFHANGGSDDKPEYAAAVAVKAGGNELKVPGGDSGAVAVDWDGDKTLDLLLGCGDGSVQWCRGKPGTSPPELEAPAVLVEKPEGKWGAGTGVRAKVCAADWNGDGKLDLLVGTYGRETPPEKTLGEKEKKELAAIEEQLKGLRKEFQAAMEAMTKKLETEIGWNRDREPTKEQRLAVSEFFQGDSPEAVLYREISGKMNEIQGKRGKGKEKPQTLGRVWFFPRT